jgi:hypothetical protein
VAVYEVTGLYKGSAVFRQYIPKKHKHFGIKIYKCCEETGYTYDMNIHVGKETQQRVQDLTVAHVTVTQKLQGHGHKLYMDKFFSSPQLFKDLAMKNLYCCGNVKPNRTGMPQDIGPKKMKLKKGQNSHKNQGSLYSNTVEGQT